MLGLRPPRFEFLILCLGAVSSHSSHHPREILLAQFSLYVHKSGLKPDSFHFFFYADNFVNYGPTGHCAVPRCAALCCATKFSKRGPTKSSPAPKNATQSNTEQMRRVKDKLFPVFILRHGAACSTYPRQ